MVIAYKTSTLTKQLNPTDYIRPIPKYITSTTYDIQNVNEVH